MKQNFRHNTTDLGYTDLVAETLESGRKYETPNGIKYPSVTTVLSILSKKGIEAWKARVGAEEAAKVGFQASNRGTDVHDCLEKYVRNDPDYGKGYMPHILSAVNKIKPVLAKRLGTVYGLEVALYSDHLELAGRVDMVAEWDGVISIIDWKTSKKQKETKWITNYFIQESSYAIMWEERTSTPITQLVTIIACDDSPAPQVFIEHRDNWTAQLINTIKRYKENEPQ